MCTRTSNISTNTNEDSGVTTTNEVVSTRKKNSESNEAPSPSPWLSDENNNSDAHGTLDLNLLLAKMYQASRRSKRNRDDDARKTNEIVPPTTVPPSLSSFSSFSFPSDIMLAMEQNVIQSTHEDVEDTVLDFDITSPDVSTHSAPSLAKKGGTLTNEVVSASELFGAEDTEEEQTLKKRKTSSGDEGYSFTIVYAEAF